MVSLHKFVSLLGLLVLLLLAGCRGSDVDQTPASSSLDPAATQLWQGLRSGELFLLLRHARAPGGGDPADFELGKRETQRNLSAAGREQARAIGAMLREQGIARARVHSSRWFRCLDTAELLDLGPVQPLPALDSFFQERSRGPQQTAQLRAWLASQKSEPSLSEPLILVTHQVNITALLNIFPAEGELLFVGPAAAGGWELRGRLP